MKRVLGIRERNFLTLTICSTIITIICTFFIYENAVNVLDEDAATYNMEKAAQVENNLSRIISQGEKLASEIVILDETKLFWGMEYPDNADESFYIKLKSYLKNLVYLTNNSTASIVLYSEKYHRILDQDMSIPYYLSSENKRQKYLQNIDWIESLPEMNDQRLVTSRQIRSVKKSYPYVLTVIKQSAVVESWGAVAIDIDLKKLYREITDSYGEDTSFWILDEEGRIIIRKNKTELFADPSSYEELSLFKTDRTQVQLFKHAGDRSFTYAQRYCPEYGFYVVAISEPVNYQESLQQIQFRIIGTSFLVICIASLLMFLYSAIAYKPIRKILNVLQMADEQELQSNSEPMEAELHQITDKILEYIQKNRRLSEELKSRMELLSQTRLNALKAQINPHFLFNTLNVIVMMIDEELEDSRSAQMVADLADILQYSLDDQDMVSLSQELDHTKRYVNIMQTRYKNFFSISYEIAPDILPLQMPKLLLQPLIENAVSHGFTREDTTKKWEIKVISKRTHSLKDPKETMLCLEVEDNGIGMEKEKIREIEASIGKENISMKHIGIVNVAKRLSILCSGKARLEIESKPYERTCIRILLPILNPGTSPYIDVQR